MAMRQEVNAPLIITVGAVSGILTVVIMIGLHAWYLYEEQKEVEAKRDYGSPPALVEHNEAQRAKLRSGPMPIERAMQVVIENKGMLPAAARPATGPAQR